VYLLFLKLTILKDPPCNVSGIACIKPSMRADPMNDEESVSLLMLAAGLL